jgi:D-galactarolactone cycloisomerase
VDGDGCIEPYDGPGLGIEVDEALFERYPGIPGPCYIYRPSEKELDQGRS